MKRICVLLVLSCLLLGCSTSTGQLNNGNVDVSPPYVNLQVLEFTTPRGTKVDLSNVNGYDDVDGLLPVYVDGYVDYNKVGVYYPSLVCTDLSGNEASVVVTINVIEKTTVDDSEIMQHELESFEVNGCALKDCKDPSIPCDAVVSSELEPYTYVFVGEEGYDIALSYVIHEESIEVITRNNGEFFGYGILKEE